MEKLTSLLWILFGIGAFVYRMVKKAQETTAQESRERPRPAPSALPDSAFAELLRNLEGRSGPVPAPAAPARGPRTPAGRSLPRETAPPVRSQERLKVKSKSLEVPATARPISPATPVARRGSSLPRAAVTAQTDPTFAQYAGAAPATETTAGVVRRLLAQPGSVRAAFVLGEIFQRRF